MLTRTAAAPAAPTPTRGPRTGPDLEGGDLVVVHIEAKAPVPAPAVLSGPDEELRTTAQAVEYVAARCLRTATPGPVGLEAEAHVVIVADPGRQPSWDHLERALSGFSPPRGSSVTLEPGGQIELSTPLFADIRTASDGLDDDETALRSRLALSGLALLNRGNDPGRSMRRIHPGSRYAAMERSFQAAGHGPAAHRMMTGTASVQLNLETGGSGAAAGRFWLAQALGPALSAAFANSPGTDDGGLWPAARMRTWLALDPSRTAELTVDPTASDEELAEIWARFALGANVLVLPDRRGGHEPGPATSFAAWLDRPSTGPLPSHRPAWSDLDYHLTTLWPPVRLRGFLEIRWLDALPAGVRRLAVTAVATLMDRAADHAAVIAAPVAGAWAVSVNAGLADAELRSVAARLLHLAAAYADGPDAAALSRWADEQTARGRCPADDTAHPALA